MNYSIGEIVNQQPEIQNFTAEIKRRLESMLRWIDRNSPQNNAEKHHYRLETFIRFYEDRVGEIYAPRNRAEEGGAAKRTELKVDDFEYREAVRAYLAEAEPELNYMKFIFGIDHWIKRGREKSLEAEHGKW